MILIARFMEKNKVDQLEQRERARMDMSFFFMAFLCLVNCIDGVQRCRIRHPLGTESAAPSKKQSIQILFTDDSEKAERENEGLDPRISRSVNELSANDDEPRDTDDFMITRLSCFDVIDAR